MTRWLRRLLLRRYIDQLCADIARLQESVDRIHNDRDAGSASARTAMWGEITGLRMALCRAMGWDPRYDADHEGKADDLVRAKHPEVYEPDESAEEILARALRHVEGDRP
jgi:hypothetical protein